MQPFGYKLDSLKWARSFKLVRSIYIYTCVFYGPIENLILILISQICYYMSLRFAINYASLSLLYIKELKFLLFLKIDKILWI